MLGFGDCCGSSGQRRSMSSGSVMTSTDLAVPQLSGAVDLDMEEFVAMFGLEINWALPAYVIISLLTELGLTPAELCEYVFHSVGDWTSNTQE